jgi:hypothetical protein
VTAAGAACAGAGTAGDLLPANAIPAPLMRRTAMALKAGWRKRAIFIVTPSGVDRTFVRSQGQRG